MKYVHLPIEISKKTSTANIFEKNILFFDIEKYRSIF